MQKTSGENVLIVEGGGLENHGKVYDTRKVQPDRFHEDAFPHRKQAFLGTLR